MLLTSASEQSELSQDVFGPFGLEEVDSSLQQPNLPTKTLTLTLFGPCLLFIVCVVVLCLLCSVSSVRLIRILRVRQHINQAAAPK